MTDLGTLGGSSSRANSINNSGQVVGDAATSSETPHAFLHSNGLMTDLGTLGGDFSQALGINNSGQIVGVADTSSGRRDAFLYSNGAMIDLNSLTDPKTLMVDDGIPCPQQLQDLPIAVVTIHAPSNKVEISAAPCPLPLICVLLALALVLVATRLYPGGTMDDPIVVGFDCHWRIVML